MAFDGWDTHSQEVGRLSRLLGGLDKAIAALRDGRDLAPTTDLRAVVKGIAVDLLGASPTQLAGAVFPGSQLVKPLSGLIA